MFEGQIFALLGHNGAGKTTTISMLTGLIKKSRGKAICYGIDLFEDMDKIREFTGICPQHDVLFDLLTPREHLDIFYDFKGGDPRLKQEEINRLIESVGLNNDRHKNACKLSSGTKRKLSVSIALCAGSKFILLDEPTAGMDLNARRKLWDILKAYKKNKIILLTTHFMDEADALADRIGIMRKGNLSCLGSSYFLKNCFSVGYRIKFVKKNRTVSPALEAFISSQFRKVKKQTDVFDEVTYVIPKDQDKYLSEFLLQLDFRLDEFDVKSYSVQLPSLEDVFLRLNTDDP